MQYPNDAAESGGDRSGVEALDLAKADAIAVALSYQYPALVGPDFAQLNACWAEIHSYTSSELPDRGEHQNRIQHTCKRLYKLAHDFKGHGGSYGYPLVSLVAESLCTLLKATDARNLTTGDTVDRHLQAIKSILDEKLRGDGGERGREITAALGIAL